MSLEVFTQPWAVALGEELQASQPYRTAAASWEGSLVLRTPESSSENEDHSQEVAPSAVFLDFWHGECRGARVAGEKELADADYVLVGESAIWQRVLAGELEPIFGIMSGKLKLTKGSLAALLPHVAAAKELVDAAARIDTHFPSSEDSP